MSRARMLFLSWACGTLAGLVVITAYMITLWAFGIDYKTLMWGASTFVLGGITSAVATGWVAERLEEHWWTS